MVQVIRGMTAGWGRVFIVVAMVCAAMGPARSSWAETKWLSVKPDRSPGKTCIASGSDEFDYYRLDRQSPLTFTVSGPRRVKVITRYVYGASDPERAEFTVRVVRDGVSHLRKAISARKAENIRTCGRSGSEVSSIRRIYLDVPAGSHTYQVYVVEEDRNVVARVFQRVTIRASKTVSLTPSEYTDVCTLQFETGSLSTYYGFDEDRPLGFEVVGPTRVKVCTRLDFDHTMNGSQAYGIEILEDGTSVKSYQYHVRKMETVEYVERPDVLAAERKCFHLRVPEGRHLYHLTIRNGTKRSATAKLYIPRADLDKGKN